MAFEMLEGSGHNRESSDIRFGVTQQDEFVIFEQPLTERVRIFLRLEFLLAQRRHHRRDESEFGVRSTLHILLDLLAVMSRSDLKTDLLKELTEQQSTLARLAKRPGVDQTTLVATLEEINAAISGLQKLANHFASNLLRESDFLTTVANRYAMPGGTCGFDLPTLHFWLSQPRALQERDLDTWAADMIPFEHAIGLYLRLLRQSREAEPVTAVRGMHIHMPSGVCHLLRAHVPRAIATFPEISASRHRFSIRFMSVASVRDRAQQLSVDVPFLMQCCTL